MSKKIYEITLEMLLWSYYRKHALSICLRLVFTIVPVTETKATWIGWHLLAPPDFSVPLAGSSQGVQPVARGPPAAQDGCDRGPA